jgi:hypothetical protein
MWIRLRNRLRFLFQRDRFDLELAEEMDFHRRMIEADKAREGLSPDEAAAGAQRQFGNSTLACEFSRDVWIIAWLDTLIADLRHFIRESLRQPALTLVAILA